MFALIQLFLYSCILRVLPPLCLCFREASSGYLSQIRHRRYLGKFVLLLNMVFRVKMSFRHIDILINLAPYKDPEEGRSLRRCKYPYLHQPFHSPSSKNVRDHRLVAVSSFLLGGLMANWLAL
ncbi:hypothetical protein CDAR_63681 [Caerostris darwini]|uniref:Uncharacterized protein n=1 Tax=Caerostris darwini TaxID=1538125 RepID=A0AAV4SB74_9ARAC|nr:hypothetical protein CDAR_63681 [Caerostris darwini]